MGSIHMQEPVGAWAPSPDSLAANAPAAIDRRRPQLVIENIADKDSMQMVAEAITWSPPSPSPSPPSAPRDRQSPMRVWMVEIFFCAMSLASFITIIAVLRAYDGRALPELPMHVTLNTFLAFFTTLTKGSFMTFLAECISQWKWNAFHTSPGRPLIDFDVLDRASRGVAGSIALLHRLKWRHLTSCAAIITVISIATTPVTQQMISYPTRRVASGEPVSVPYTRRWGALADALTNTDLARAVTEGMTRNTQDPMEHFRPLCPTGNCTFPRYTSLAVCAQTADISHLLNVTRIENSQPSEWFGGPAYIQLGMDEPRTAYNVSLPNGFGIVTPAPFTAVQRTGHAPIAFASDPNASNFTAVAHVFNIYSNEGNVSDPAYRPTDPRPGGVWDFRAVETLYHLCVNTYQTEVIAGRHSTTVVASSYAPLLSAEGNQPAPMVNCSTTWDFEGSVGSCPPNQVASDGVTILRDPDDPEGLDPTRNFTIERMRAGVLSQSLQISVHLDIIYTGEWNSHIIFNGPATVPFFTALYGRKFNVTTQEEHMARLAVYHNNTAIALSNYIRAESPDVQEVAGTAWKEETYVKIRWGWSAWLAVQLLASYVLLASTVIHTHRTKAPVWKSSALAVMMAPTEDVRSAVGSMEDMKEGERHASSVKAKLKGGRLTSVVETP
ncbi:hypothetical protein MFIFM68171_08007 [Madurella fahalii]|uniref:Uncharacterized protein n=1 Tax=Madurella fahalii TaxID=1157608 RepID=A0ABQ0GJ57_9PEZI